MSRYAGILDIPVRINRKLGGTADIIRPMCFDAHGIFLYNYLNKKE